jgi:hypothetical protein
MAKSAYDVTERSVSSHMFSRFWKLVEGGGFQIFEYVRAQKGRVQFMPPKERRMKLLKLYVIVVWTITYGVLFISTTAVAQWLRYCTTNQKVAGSIPDGIFH